MTHEGRRLKVLPARVVVLAAGKTDGGRTGGREGGKEEVACRSIVRCPIPLTPFSPCLTSRASKGDVPSV
jgi:hypothetical protein